MDKDFKEDTPMELARYIIRKYGILIYMGGLHKGGFYRPVSESEIEQKLIQKIDDTGLDLKALRKIKVALRILRTECKSIVRADKNQADLHYEIRQGLGMAK